MSNICIDSSFFVSKQAETNMSTKTQKRKSDLYCWICCKKSTNIQCVKCLRSYHSQCLEEIELKCGICEICILDEEFENTDKYV